MAEAQPAAGSRFARLAAGLGKRLGTQPHLMAIRDGVVSALPLVLASSVLVLIAQPPIPAWSAWMAPHAAPLLAAARALSGGIAIYVAFAVAASLAKTRGVDPISTGLTAVGGLLLAAAEPGAPRIPLERLAQSGLFAGLLVGLLSAEVAGWVRRRELSIRLPPGVPPAVERSFAALVPTLLVLSLLLALRLLGFDLVGAAAGLGRPLVHLAGSFGGVLAICLVDSGLYYFGIHPGGVMAVLQPVWLSMLTENMSARMAGAAIAPHIATREFFLWFVWQGGTGATLGLTLCLLIARAPSLRAVGRIGLIPAVFNINEPILFGVPLVLNPEFLVPFLLAPAAQACVAYFAFAHGWVARPSFEVLWTLPAPVGAVLACGDWRALVLELFDLTLATAIWWPFVRRSDARRLAIEGVPELRA